jgi:hypothetical protein
MVTFAYPYSAPHTRTLTLRNPELGDARQLNIKTQAKQTMWGLFYTYKKTPATSKFVLTFTTLDLTEMLNLRSFHTWTIGQEIEYTDHNAVNWKVRMVSEPLVITTDKDSCSYQTTIELITV